MDSEWVKKNLDVNVNELKAQNRTYSKAVF